MYDDRDDFNARLKIAADNLLKPMVPAARSTRAQAPKVESKPLELKGRGASLLTPVDERNLRAVALALIVRKLRGGHLYGGTVPAHVKANRRAANRVARRSRRLNRISAR